MTLEGIVTAAGVVLFFVIALLPVALLVLLANRHLAGRKSRLDGLFGGIGRAAQANSHLRGGTPFPDDLGLHVPLRPDGMPASRRRRHR
jgi:hypothetical protein